MDYFYDACFGVVKKRSLNIVKMSSFVRREKVVQIWNEIRLSKSQRAGFKLYHQNKVKDHFL